MMALGRVALVTGASSGIGAATAVGLAEAKKSFAKLKASSAPAENDELADWLRRQAQVIKKLEKQVERRQEQDGPSEDK